ncbi:hypothetical protein C2845_PM01G10750 [Panicum miliaceum]|uniref:Uncharacterized protein n=1 Tax=Panicum miliaceum TaxID=4540 RepID=A0A3L6TNK2_PANMI|nr:hypothetical protein C2845_PM01G10750 [Panicum miliaceum]
MIELEGRQLGDKAPAGRAGQALPERIKLLEAVGTTSSSALIRAGPALVAWDYPGLPLTGTRRERTVVHGRRAGVRGHRAAPWPRGQAANYGSAACHWLRSVRIGSFSCVHRQCRCCNHRALAPGTRCSVG